MVEKIFSKNVPFIQKRVDLNLEAATTEATFLISGESQRRAPLGPTGNLRANVFRNVFRRGKKWVGEFIHLEPYAEKQHKEIGYVHPLGGEAEYAKKAMEENVDKVQAIWARGALK